MNTYNNYSDDEIIMYKKYLKYKNKYLQLQKIMKGGNNNESDNYLSALKNLYSDISHKPRPENNTAQDRTHTYGEMQFEGIEKLYEHLLKEKNKNINYFIDIGSGYGKIPLWFGNIPTVVKSIGFEIIEERHNGAQKNLEELKKNYPNIISKIKLTIDDINQQIANSPNTLIWMSNLCFGEDLTKKIFDKILPQLPTEVIICCSAPINDDRLKKIGQVEIQMTWNSSSTVIILEKI